MTGTFTFHPEKEGESLLCVTMCAVLCPHNMNNTCRHTHARTQVQSRSAPPFRSFSHMLTRSSLVTSLKGFNAEVSSFSQLKEEVNHQRKTGRLNWNTKLTLIQLYHQWGFFPLVFRKIRTCLSRMFEGHGEIIKWWVGGASECRKSDTLGISQGTSPCVVPSKGQSWGAFYDVVLCIWASTTAQANKLCHLTFPEREQSRSSGPGALRCPNVWVMHTMPSTRLRGHIDANSTDETRAHAEISLCEREHCNCQGICLFVYNSLFPFNLLK